MASALPPPVGTVTFLFTDIEGSTQLWEQQPEAMRLALPRHDALLTVGIEKHGGRVVKSRGEGDSFFAVFAQAPDALAAACGIQEALLKESWPSQTPIRVRMALHMDTADLREGDYYGAGVIRCARLRDMAHGGQVLISRAALEASRDRLPEGVTFHALGNHHLKGLQQPEHVFQCLHPALPAEFPPLLTLDVSALNLPSGTLTFLFTDVEGYARLWNLHPEVMDEVMARHNTLLRQAIQTNGGLVFKAYGDSFCAVFAAAADGTAAAVAAQRAVNAEAWPNVGSLLVRMALHTGAAQEREGDYCGPTLNQVARLVQAGHGGQTLLSQATADLVRDVLPKGASLRDLGQYRLRDMIDSEGIFQLVHSDLPADFPPLATL